MCYILIIALLWLAFLPEGTGLNSADGTGQLMPDGTARNTSGKSDKCCCGCGSCWGCLNAPCWVTVTIAGWKGYECCKLTAGAAYINNDISPNGTYDFPIQNCLVGKDLIPYLDSVYVNYSFTIPNGCTDYLGMYSDGAQIFAQNTSGTLWNFHGITGQRGGGQSTFFNGNGDAGTTCPTSISFVNTFSDAGAGSFDRLSTGICGPNYRTGGATLTFHYGPWPFNPPLP